MNCVSPNKFRDRSLPLIRESIADKIYNRNVDAASGQAEILRSYAPHHPLLLVYDARVAMKSGNFGAAAAKILGIDVDVDDDSTWFAMDILKDLLAGKFITFGKACRFISDVEERKPGIFNDYCSFIEEMLVSEIKGGRFDSEGNENFEFLRLFPSGSVRYNLIMAVHEAQNRGGAALQFMKKFDNLQDEETALLSLNLYEQLWELGIVSQCEVDNYCRKCIFTFPESNSINASVRQLSPGISSYLNADRDNMKKPKLTLLKGGAYGV